VIKWISESNRLPLVGQNVLLATPRQAGKFWDIQTAVLLARHEDVNPRPVQSGGKWPVDYYWGRSVHDTCLVTGNGWWALLDRIPLPPKAAHDFSNGYHSVRQVGDVFVPRLRAERDGSAP